MLTLGMVAIACALIAAIGRTAGQRGRSAVAWSVAAILSGGVGFLVGTALMALVLVLSSLATGEVSSLAYVSVFLSPLLTIAPMVGLLVAVKRLPVLVQQRDVWPMHFFGHGDGSATLRAGTVAFAWDGGGHEVARSALHTIEADGETVRIVANVDGKEVSLTMIPGGSADLRDVRIAQCKHFADLLRGDLPEARVLR